MRLRMTQRLCLKLPIRQKEREREKEEEKADIKFVSAFRSDLISLHVHYVSIKNRVDLLS